MTVIVLSIWDNGQSEKRAQLVTDDDGNPRYFEDIEAADEGINHRFPADFLAIDLETLEVERL